MVRGMFPLLALSLALLLAPPAPGARADAAALGLVARGAVLSDRPLARPYALCLLGQGEAGPVIEALRADGFAVETVAEMGATFLTSPRHDYSVSLYMDGLICDVSTERTGTDGALATLMVLAGLVGWSHDDGECTRLRVAGARAEVTSTGNDPVCFDARTSNLRFAFGEAAN